MPSFAVHTICGDKLLKELSVSEEDRIKFLIGNILPDTKTIDIPDDIDEVSRRSKIQSMKMKTHFRTDKNAILQYPDLEYFLSKYEEQVKNDINALAYFFHLYTDTYYFTRFLPSFVTFLDKDGNKATIRKDIENVHIKKTDEYMTDASFWSKYNERGIYQEYSRSNKFLLERYPFSFDIERLKEYLIDHPYKVNIEEINPDKALEGVEQLEMVIINSMSNTNNNLYIFTNEEMAELVEKVVSSFIKEYGYLLQSYQKPLTNRIKLYTI